MRQIQSPNVVECYFASQMRTVPYNLSVAAFRADFGSTLGPPAPTLRVLLLQSYRRAAERML